MGVMSMSYAPGEMSEWSKETDSKSVVPSDGTEGSNPSLSDNLAIFLVSYAVITPLERCPSGRWCTLGRRVC